MDPEKAKKIYFLKEKKTLAIGELALIAMLLIFSSALFGKKPSFEIEDKCGKFVNLFTHTIKDDDTCKMRCTSQCSSLEYSYKTSDFSENLNGCNSCKCYCG